MGNFKKRIEEFLKKERITTYWIEKYDMNSGFDTISLKELLNKFLNRSYIKFLIEVDKLKYVKEDHTLTNDANKALQFELKAEAIFYMARNLDKSPVDGYRVEEHEFVDDNFIQLNDKYKKDFNAWLKTEKIEIDTNNIWINGVALNDNETIFDVYNELKPKSTT